MEGASAPRDKQVLKKGIAASRMVSLCDVMDIYS